MDRPPDALVIALLADHPAQIAAIGDLRWREWGGAPGEPDRAAWAVLTAREAGRDAIPLTWVALDPDGAALGAVALIADDGPAGSGRGPWIGGMIVRPDRRGRGIGGRLLGVAAAWARDHGHRQLWVATGGRAVAFYARHGFTPRATFPGDDGDTATILVRAL